MTWGSPILRNLHISVIFLGKGYITTSFYFTNFIFWRWQPKYNILMPMVFTQCHKSYFCDGTSRDLQSWWDAWLLAPAYYKEVMNLFNMYIYTYIYIYMWEIKVGAIYIYIYIQYARILRRSSIMDSRQALWINVWKRSPYTVVHKPHILGRNHTRFS